MQKKHAFLIGCYKNPDYLYDFIKSLDGNRSVFYIHVNKENYKEFDGLREKLKEKKNITFVPSIRVIWGGITLLKSLKIMLNEALKDKENYFFHFLTGQDALVKPVSELYAFFDSHSSENFIPMMQMMNSASINSKELDLIQYYHLYDKVNVRNNLFARWLEKIVINFQKILKIKRKLPYEKIYKGSGWFSINRSAAEVLEESLNNDTVLKKWENTFATEEFFIPTILKNSIHNLIIVNRNLYYIDWCKGPGPFPSILDMSFYEDIINSDCFFCRKIDPVYSKDLLELLKQKREETL